MFSRVAMTTQIIVLLFVFPCVVDGQNVLEETPPPIQISPTQESPQAEPLPPTRMTPELLMKLARLGEAAISADGKNIAYSARRYDLEQNEGSSTLYIIDLTSSAESIVVQDWPTVNSIQWAKSGPGEKLFFIGNSPDNEVEGGASQSESDDEESESSPQAWAYDVAAKKLCQLTSVKDGIANLKVAPTGKYLAFTYDVKMDKEVTELYEDLPKANARIIDNLMYRHWDQWHDYKYTHLHVGQLNPEGGFASETRDLMKGIRADCPIPPFGGSEQFNWSPDGKEIAFSMKDVQRWAESTDSDVYVVQVEGDTPPKNITKGMPGYDNDPNYSPDGKYLAFQSMERAGFEADRNRIMLVDRDTGQIRDLTEQLDQTSHGINWMPDSKSLLFSSETMGTNQIFQISVDSPGAKQVSQGRFNWGVVAPLPDGKSALVTKMSMLRPNELSVLSLADSTDEIVTHLNDEIYKTLELPKIEERWVEATDGEKIHCWVIHPPNFDPAAEQKWPMLTYFQGGPQGQIGQWFSYRWNFHLMAAQGYVVLAPNRRGLPGFGQKWNDQISGDWGGQAMKDILSATDDMIQESYIDDKRVAGIGASFGGYTAYWMMGHHRDRFCTLVAHCGVFNLESMYGATEELFFVNWDMGGPYWKNEEIQQSYNKFSPHRFAKKWKTPLLVIHGQKDFRVPVTQAMEAFTVAQVQGIPSRFLYFPEEGHWVQQPQNSVLWQRVFYEWLDRYCKNPKPAEPTPAKTDS